MNGQPAEFLEAVVGIRLILNHIPMMTRQKNWQSYVILESICPAVSFIQYKNLYNTLVKYDTYSVGEYYGNSTNYAYKVIDLQELFDYLKERGLIE